MLPSFKRASFHTPQPTDLSDSSSNSEKPSLLCLHGWRSNADITRLQLTNLGLDTAFEPSFIEGPIIDHAPADSQVELMSSGPYYSWAPQDKNNEQQGGHDSNAGLEELLVGVRSLLAHLVECSKNTSRNRKFCYDAVYGFSQGAAMVTIISNTTIRNRLLAEIGEEPMTKAPWKFAFLACAANTCVLDALAVHFDMKPDDLDIKLPSVHYLGLTDGLKGQSEHLMRLYDDDMALPFYLDCGHEIPASTKLLHYITPEVMTWYHRFTIADRKADPENIMVALEEGRDNLQQPFSEQESAVSMISVVDEIRHFRENRVSGRSDAQKDISIPHIGNYGMYVLSDIESSHMNLHDMLASANPNDIVFRAPEAKPLTYGSLIDFIWGGDGDLRQIGVKPNFCIAYAAPFGAVSATAFVSIAAQCTAAPLDPAYNKTEVALALQQLKPNLIVVFEGVDPRPFEEAAETEGIQVHHASTIPGSCGLYQFVHKFQYDASEDTLVNPSENNGLILRTSGTTSKPKVVPLKMSSIMSNAKVIAKNLGLKSTDVALNAMPLFHIGGLSANLLSSLAAGASVILLRQFNVEEFSDFLAGMAGESPTWYSAVPTMHAAITQHHQGMDFKHKLRFIRSGADAMPQDLALRMEDLFGVPLVLTYSMTEQMPITQPETGFSIPTHKPTSVGRTVAASMCLVDRNMRPLLPDESGETTGEVCISGPMVTSGYIDNPTANASAFFRLGGMDWFRTGDVGRLDKDGYLFLTGRSKELIKRGGEQVSPYEVEEALRCHPDIDRCVVFAVPDPFWGERVGVAIIGDAQDMGPFKKQLYQFLKDQGVQQYKFPEEIVFVTEDQLPKTRSNKYIRTGLAEKLGINDDKANKNLQDMKPVRFHDAVIGVRFILALWVFYVHVGEFDKYDYQEGKQTSVWSFTRSWCFHTPLFFFVGGFLLAAGTHLPVTGAKDLMNFYALRIASLHPMYLVSILFCAINFIARCRPQNYIDEFDINRKPLDDEYFVCQATPASMSWWGTFATSMLTYATGLQAWPMFFPISWFISFYTWFSSVYIFCIFVFPWCHKPFMAAKDNTRGIWKLTIIWTVFHFVYLGLWALYYTIDDSDTDSKNWFALSAYLLPIGWVPCFAIGVAAYFLFRHYSPNTGKYAERWGELTDAITLFLLAGYLSFGLWPKELNPDFNEASVDSRVWASWLSRCLFPIGAVWVFGMAVGRGHTAKLFSVPFLVGRLAPASYNVFLFHQPVAEWYYAATRGVWWAFPKSYYWFSPYPFPVTGWEFFIVLFLTIALSMFMEAYVNEWLVRNSVLLMRLIVGGSKQQETQGSESVLDTVVGIIADLTYADVNEDTNLSETGLSSMTTILLVGEIKKRYKSLSLSVRDCANAESVGDLVKLIEGRLDEANVRPELSLQRSSMLSRRGESSISSRRQSARSSSVHNLSLISIIRDLGTISEDIGSRPREGLRRQSQASSKWLHPSDEFTVASCSSGSVESTTTDCDIA